MNIIKVLSSTIANGLRFFYKRGIEEMANFVENFDKFFDALNVSNYNESYKSLKPFRAPYRYKLYTMYQRSDHTLLLN